MTSWHGSAGSRLSVAARLAATVMLSMGAAGCIGVAHSTQGYDPGAAAIPACAHAGNAVDLPSGFPDDFPFPKGTAITSTGREGSIMVVHGFVPSTNFDRTVSFFATEPKKHGYATVDVATEEEKAEQSFRSKTYAGDWQLRHIDGCPRAVRLDMSVARLPHAKR